MKTMTVSEFYVLCKSNQLVEDVRQGSWSIDVSRYNLHSTIEGMSDVLGLPEGIEDLRKRLTMVVKGEGISIRKGKTFTGRVG